MATTRPRKSGTAKRKSAGPKVDAYELVTNQIIEALEAGFVPWHKPWSATNEGPMSLSTRKPYTGVNVFILGATAMVKGYESRWWGTYKQISERGGQVRKGEKSTSIVFWRFFERKDTAGNVVESIPVLRYYSVFNADQCDDLNAPEEAPVAEFVPLEECERISTGYLVGGNGPSLSHGGDRAFYSPTLDSVRMPKQASFETREHYYGTLFHEYAHSTGAESRLNRKTLVDAASFGDESYSREELVAEMTAAFVCGASGIEVNVQHHAGYVGHWIGVLKGDPKMVVTAGGAAQKAANLILGRNPAAEAQTESEAS